MQTRWCTCVTRRASSGARGRADHDVVLLVAGTPPAFLFTPPLYGLFVVSLVLPPSTLAGLFPAWVLWVSLVNLLVGNVLDDLRVDDGSVQEGAGTLLVLWALLNPVYWLLHRPAAYKALWQLVTKPHYWEKTVHGLSHAAHRLPDTPGGPAPTLAR